jgi:hypothetical protein
MINQIKNDAILQHFLCSDCEENGICATIEDSITEEEIAIIKVDGYYNSLHLKCPPPSTDFLVSIDCEEDSYILYLIELKNINSPKGFNVGNVYQKFRTAIEDFMSIRFNYIYMNKKYKIKNLLLYFVTDPYGLKIAGMSYDDYRKKKNTLKVDNILLQKPFVFNGKAYLIRPVLPNPLIQKT